MIGWEYPPKNSGGLGVACQGIVEHLVDAGQDVLLVLPQESTPTEEQVLLKTAVGNSYPVIFIQSNLNPYPESTSEKYQGNFLDDVYLYAARISSAIAKEKFDIIHIHDWLTVPAGLALKTIFKKPLLMQVHSTEFDRTAGGDPDSEVGKIEKEGLEKADRLVAVSEYTKNIVTEKYGIKPDKVSVVHNGINVDSVSSSRPDFMGDVPVVLFVGRLTIQKGPEYFIRLAEHVLRIRPETIFVVAGDGDMYQKMIEYSAFRELTGSVLFTGFMRDVNKLQLYRRADVFVMPSVSEPFGIVALEAAAMGTPVIISKTSGVAEVLPSAKQVDFWDTDLTAELILEIVRDHHKKEQLGERLKREASEVTWSQAATKLLQIYQILSKDYA